MSKLEAQGDLSLIRDALLLSPFAQVCGPQQASGVLTSKGALIENAISGSTSSEPVNSTPNMFAPDEIAPLAGT